MLGVMTKILPKRFFYRPSLSISVQKLWLGHQYLVGEYFFDSIQAQSEIVVLFEVSHVILWDEFDAVQLLHPHLLLMIQTGLFRRGEPHLFCRDSSGPFHQ